MKNQFKQGDKVKNRHKTKIYQRCTVLEIEEGCNGRIKVVCEDGMYTENEESYFCPQDLIHIEDI